MERLPKYDPRVSSAEVIFDEEKHTRKVEAILSVHGGPPVVAHAEEREFLNALDRVADRLSTQLRRTRDKIVDHQGPSLAKEAPEEAPTEE